MVREPQGSVTVLIRLATDRDVDAVRAIARRAYHGYIEVIGREPAPMGADYERLISAGQVTVCEVEGDVVGVLVMVPDPAGLHIENVAVEPNRQGEGFGRALLDHAEQEALRRGITRIHLYTNEAMEENLAIYEHLGYEQFAQRTEDGSSRVYFEKPVDPEDG